MEQATDARAYRLSNIDMIRGLVLLIMAIDHVRDFFLLNTIPDPMMQTDVPISIYVTRWLTHFCAPVFVFLAGTSAGLMADRKSPNQLAAFLFKRGLWIIVIEITILSTALTFSPFNGVEQVGGQTILSFQVLWAIGASMLVLALAQYLGGKFCLVLGASIILGHNMLDTIWPIGELFSGNNPLWYALHTKASTNIGPFLLVFPYPVIPWIGVMLLGFGSAYLFKLPAKHRDKQLVHIGLLMMAAFFILRYIGVYGDPNPWFIQAHDLKATITDFFNVSKYPPSLLFLLITLGPMAILCAYADKTPEKIKTLLVMFGRVPFAFYIAHFYLIRLISLLLAQYQGFETSQMMTYFFFFPEGYGVSLTWVYIVWGLVITLLYPLCKWVANMKAKRKDWWLSYV